MSNRNIYNAARGYMVANAIAGGVASELAAENRRQAARLAEASLFNAYYMSEKQLSDRVGHCLFCRNTGAAYDFLNNALRTEIIHDCQNQTSFTTHLANLIEQRKAKYRPFYQKIERSMPDSIEKLTAEEICSVMSVRLMTPEELNKYHADKKAKEDAEKFSENVGLVFRAILIIGLIVMMICLSAQ